MADKSRLKYIIRSQNETIERYQRIVKELQSIIIELREENKKLKK